MSTYFGYVEREADNYINWADVSRDLTTTFNDINRVREEKKQALDDDFRAELKKLTLQPKGKSEEANKFITEYGDNASNFLLMQNRLLKAGKSKLKDYIYATQNVSDGTENLFKIMKDYQANYGENMERYEKEISSSAELWNLSQVEKFADFSKSGAYIAGDGSVSVAMKTMKNVDGQEIYTLDTKPGEVASLSVLSDVVNKKINRYKVNEKTTEIAKAAGVYIESMYINGQIASKEDITSLKYGQDPLETEETLRNAIADLSSNERKELILSTDEKTKVSKTAEGNETEVAKMYKEAKAKAEDKMTDLDKKVINFVETKLSDLIEKSKGPIVDFYKSETDIIRAAISTPENYMSVLADNKKIASNGKPYDFKAINSKEEADQIVKDNPNLICMLNGSPVLTEGQEKEAVEFMRGIVRTKYTLKEVDKGTTSKVDIGMSTPPKEKATKEEREEYAKNQKAIDFGQYVSWLYNGNDAQIAAAIDHFSGFGILIDRTPDGIYIEGTNKDGQKVSTNKSFWSAGSNPSSLGPEYFYVGAANTLNSLLPQNVTIENVEMGKRGIKNKNIDPNMTTWTYNLYPDEGSRSNAKRSFTNKSRDYQVRLKGKSSAQGGESQGSSNLNASDRKPK
jgi:hypothetical protein